MSMTRRALNVLIIDHYDSYTNNLLQLLPTGQEKDPVDAIAWNPRIIRYDQYTWCGHHVLPNATCTDINEERFQGQHTT